MKTVITALALAAALHSHAALVNTIDDWEASPNSITAINSVAAQGFWLTQPFVYELGFVAQGTGPWIVTLWDWPMTRSLWEGTATVEPLKDGFDLLTVEPSIALRPGRSYFVELAAPSPFEAGLVGDLYSDGRSWITSEAPNPGDLAFKVEALGDRERPSARELYAGASVPEPANTGLLMGLGLLLITFWRRRK